MGTKVIPQQFSQDTKHPVTLRIIQQRCYITKRANLPTKYLMPKYSVKRKR